MNYALIAGCAALFLFQLSLGEEVGDLIRRYGFVPDDFRAAWASGEIETIWAAAILIFTSMFLHGSWIHVIGNLLYLRVFGDNVEDHLGHLAFILFYLLSGIAGAVGQYLFDPVSTVPVVGASGAIAGILGAYIVLFPKAKVVTLFPIFIFLTFIEVPAIFFLGIWGLQQLLNGYLALGEGLGTGVAWFAHLGGFGFGLAVGLLVKIVRRKPSRSGEKPKAEEPEPEEAKPEETEPGDEEQQIEKERVQGT